MDITITQMSNGIVVSGVFEPVMAPSNEQRIMAELDKMTLHYMRLSDVADKNNLLGLSARLARKAWACSAALVALNSK